MRKLSKKRLLLGVFFLLFLLTFSFILQNNASAAGLNDAFSNANDVASSSGYKATDIYTMVGNMILTALSLIGTIFIILMIYAGFEWMTAAGNEQKTDKAKMMIKQSIIGLVIIIAAYAITYFIISLFGSQLKI